MSTAVAKNPDLKGKVVHYGVTFKKGIHPLAVELAMFREKMSGRMAKNQGGLGPEHHFMKVARMIWPEKDGVEERTGRRIVYPIKFIWNSWNKKMLHAACHNNYVAIAGCSGFGKSELFAIWAIVNFLCDPANTLCILTSVTIGASRKKMWAKIVQYWTPCEKLGLPGKLVDSQNVIRYMDKDGKFPKGEMAGIGLIAADKKKEKEAVGKLIGIHQERIIFVADELTDLAESVTEAAFYNLASGCRYFQFIGISNPASYFDPFGKFAKPKDGWDSITVDDEEWVTDRGICLHFDSTKNPRILGDERCFWMDSQEDIDKQIAIHGGKTAQWWRMKRAFWCPTGVEEVIYTETEIVGCKAQDKAVWLNNTLTHCSFVDLSWTLGGDRTICYFGTMGTNLSGLKTLNFDDYQIFYENVEDKEFTREQQLIKWWKALCLQRNVTPRACGFDATAAGGISFGRQVGLMWSKEPLGINFGGAASELPVSAYDPTPSNKRYVNRVTELWMTAKQYLATGQIKGIGDDLAKELQWRKIKHEKTEYLRTRILSKREMKAETGQSCDIADAAMGLVELCRQRMGFDSDAAARQQSPDAKSNPQNSFKQLFRKFQSVYVN